MSHELVIVSNVSVGYGECVASQDLAACNSGDDNFQDSETSSDSSAHASENESEDDTDIIGDSENELIELDIHDVQSTDETLDNNALPM